MKISVSVATAEARHRQADIRATFSLWIADGRTPDHHFIFPSHEALQQFIAFLNDSAAAFAPRIQDAAE